MFSLSLHQRDPRHKSWMSQGESQACAHVCACGALLPVIGGQLAASDVWHRSDPAALVLPIPNGAGHLQHTQDTPVPKTRGKHSDRLPDRGHSTYDLILKQKHRTVRDAACGLRVISQHRHLPTSSNTQKTVLHPGHYRPCCPGASAQRLPVGTAPPFGCHLCGSTGLVLFLILKLLWCFERAARVKKVRRRGLLGISI